MTNAEISFIMDAIELTASNYEEWAEGYDYDTTTNEYTFKKNAVNQQHRPQDWFDMDVRSNAVI